MKKYDIKQISEKLTTFFNNITPIFVEMININIRSYIKDNNIKPSPQYQNKEVPKNVAVALSGLSEEDYALITLKAYLLWGIGAYLVNKKILKKREIDKLIENCFKLLCKDTKESLLKNALIFIEKDQYDRIKQCENIIIYLIDVLRIIFITALDFDDLEKIVMYHVPILELLLGYLALYLNKLVNPDNVIKQEEIIKEFESATLNTYEVDLDKIHSIIVV